MPSSSSSSSNGSASGWTVWWSQLRLLIWKNACLKRASWQRTLTELVIPLLIVFVLMLVRQQVGIDTVQEQIPIGDELRIQGDLPEFLYTMSCGMVNPLLTRASEQGDRYSRGHIALAPASLDIVHTIQESMQSHMLSFIKSAEALLNTYPLQYYCYDNGDYISDASAYVTDEMFRFYDDEAAINAYIQDSQYSINASMSIIEYAIIVNSADVANAQYDYTIRVNSTDIPSTSTNVNNLNVGYSQATYAQYFYSHVLTLQTMVDRVLLQNATRRAGVVAQDLVWDMSFVPFPVSATKQDNFASYVSSVFGLMMLGIFMWPFANLVRCMVMEKEARIQEGMKMMGMLESAWWQSWLTVYALGFLVLSLIATLLMHASIFTYSSIGIIFLFLFVFTLSLLSIANLVASFFTRAKAATMAAPFILFVLFLPSFALSDTTAAGTKTFASLLSPVAFALGSSTLLSYDSAFVGVTPSTIGTPYDNYAISTALAMMLFDTLLYLLLSVYIDAVRPSEFGRALPPHFLCMPSFWRSWCKRSQGSPQASSQSQASALRAPLLDSSSSSSMSAPSVQSVRSGPPLSLVSPLAGSADYEPVPATMYNQLAVAVRSLVKRFGPVHAVNGTNFDMFEGQIFCLLGHNGAGKTTTIHMLTGMHAPTAGTATMYGLDINTEMDAIRTMIGVCPQHDALFDVLTVRQHLVFYARLKGVPLDQLEAVVEESLADVQLQAAQHQTSVTLSGGQKRRLSLAIALIGDSRVLFLDEPTSGVDPFSRRAIWELLARKKKDRVIVLTTHFMDEADQLGDRIGIMHQGQMKCVGSPLFLKNRFGVGYCLTFNKLSAAVAAPSSRVTDLIRVHVPTAELLSDVGTELSYRLPIASSSSFPRMLEDIDAHLVEFGLASYGLSVTTMEEVFLRVANDGGDGGVEAQGASGNGNGYGNGNGFAAHHNGGGVGAIAPPPSYTSLDGNAPPQYQYQQQQQPQQPQQLQQQRQLDMRTVDDVDFAKLSADSSNQGGLRHFVALLAKRYHITKRDSRAACCQIVLPVLLLLFGFALLRVPTNFDTNPLTLSLDRYNQPLYVPTNDLFGATDYPLPSSAVIVPSNATTLLEFEREILASRLDHKQSQYGAFFNGPSNATNVTYVLPSLDPIVVLMNETIDGINATWSHYYVLTNQSAVHGLPTFLNAGNQAVLRYVSQSPTATIRTTIHPFEWTQYQKAFISTVNGVLASIVLSLAFAFVPASFAVFIVHEREIKSKHLQFISGVSPWMYWLANYVWDIIAFLIPAFACVALMWAFDLKTFTGANFPVVVSGILLYGLSVIPFTYILSFLFSSHSSAQTTMIFVYLATGVFLSIVGFVLYLVPKTHDLDQNVLRFLFRLLPPYCLGDLVYFLSISEFAELDRWDKNVSGYDLLFMAVESLGYFIIVLIIEFIVSTPKLAALFLRDPPMHAPLDAEDVDVRAERERLEATATEAAADDAVDLVRLEGLRKVFPRKTAVKDVWFGVPAGQVFGFLGVNGAGKSTTLKILTGDILPSSGRALVGGFDIATQPVQCRRLLGYCPQFDAFQGNMTAVETLSFYGRIRGVPESRLPGMVAYLIDRLSLNQYAHLPARGYSGGNKRKLSVGIALIGNPPVVFLDEPSTGMDPVSRRFMWDFLTRTMAKRAVILTTHSMEECEALCSRIGMLVQGRMKCIGSSQHLKTRFGHGFMLEVGLGAEREAESFDRLAAFFARRFGGVQVASAASAAGAAGGNVDVDAPVQLLERNGCNSKWAVRAVGAAAGAAAAPLHLRDMFLAMEAAKHEAGIDVREYSVGQTSLEQIFLQFARDGAITASEHVVQEQH